MALRKTLSPLALVLALPLVACGSAITQPAAAPVVLAPGARPVTVRDALYVSATSENLVDGYRSHRKNPPPFRRLTKGLAGPAGMAVDSSNDLYVANETGSASGTVTVYRPHESKPFRTYSNKIDQPVDVAIAPDGTTYISNVDAVTVYPSGSTTSSLTLKPPPGFTPFGVTTDITGRVYVAYVSVIGNLGAIYAYDAGKVRGKDLGIALAGPPHGIIVDPSGNLIVAVSIANSGSDIEIYPPGTTTPSQRFYGPSQPMMLALNPNANRLYVADYGTGNNDGAVFVFSYPSGSLRSKDTQGAAESPFGVVFDRS